MERPNDYQRKQRVPVTETWTLVNSMGQPDNQPPASPVRQQPHVSDCYNRNARNYMGRRGGAAAEVRRVIAPRGGPRRSSGQPDNKHCKADKTQRPDETARLAYTGSSEMRAAYAAVKTPQTKLTQLETSRLGEDLLNADTAQLASAEHKTQSLAEEASSAEPEPMSVPIGTDREEGAVHIVSQTESLHTVETDCARRDCAPESMADPRGCWLLFTCKFIYPSTVFQSICILE
ncbi:hypothetical protein DPEC_G00370620 [Dallia pectoralis]|nr:hypothetical protein DPEC_G00370620 [Dallia pectoralis]